MERCFLDLACEFWIEALMSCVGDCLPIGKYFVLKGTGSKLFIH